MNYAVALPDTQGRYCYLTRGKGDPPRSYDPKLANRYKTKATAKAAITRALKRSGRKRAFVVIPYPEYAKTNHPNWLAPESWGFRCMCHLCLESRKIVTR
jgi:hypothetical protein